jgi:hypothetical protein
LQPGAVLIMLASFFLMFVLALRGVTPGVAAGPVQ